MGFARFYGHFAAAYGTIWLALLFAALVSQSHIDAGEFGLFGFPVVSLIYAAIRVNSSGQGPHEIDELRRRLARLEHQGGASGQR